MSFQGVRHCRWLPSAWIAMPGCGGLPTHEQGILALGIPVGHVEYVQAQLLSTTEEHKTFYQRIQSVQDLQSAWFLFLFCANTRATY